MTLSTIKFSSILNYLDGLFWQEQYAVDDSSYLFYVFKPFPESLTHAEKKQWCSLQVEVSSPFTKSYNYQYISAFGIHFWFSKTELLGVPETALQTAIEDGLSSFRGRHFCYKQKWRNQVMIECIATPRSSSINNSKVPTLPSGNAWAVNKKIYKAISSPKFWAKIGASLASLVLLFLTIGTITIWSQTTWLQSKNQQLTQQIGPKLEQRQTLTAANDTIDKITQWHSLFGNMPIALSKTLSTLVMHESIYINTVQWQNQLLSVEFSVNQIDITQLVEMSQSLQGVKSAQIIPHNDTNTWILEVQW